MRIILILFSILFLSACDFLGKLDNPAGPSSYLGNPDITNLTSWYPCVTVHTPAFRGNPEFEKQFEAIRKLQASGRMTWIRFGQNNSDYYDEARILGLRIYSILDTEELEASSTWQEAFDLAYLRHPNDIWQIAGEISNPAIHSVLLTPETYMTKFKELYSYIRRAYPHVTLVSAPTFGSASTGRNPVGPVEFEKFIELGLLDMDVVIGINVYTERALQQYASIFSHHRAKLANKRIWIPETGIGNPSRQIEWVQSFYPKLISSFHPEMICWYALWVGDQPGGEHDYGMIDQITTPNMTEGDLFKALTGSQ